MSFKPNLAMVLSGGGPKGSFQVGVMEELITNRGVNFDIFGGVSTGALQAVGGAQDQIEELKGFWLQIKKNKDIYTKREGLVGGLLGNDSLYGTAPLRRKIRAFVDADRLKRTGKKLVIGAVSLQTGEFSVYREDNSDIAEWVIASTAVPVAFPTLRKNHEKHVDGGVRNITPLSSVMDLKPSAIVVVLASPLERETEQKRFGNLFKIGKRAVAILENEVFRTDIARAALINNLVKAYADLDAGAKSIGLSESEKTKFLDPINKVLKKYNVVEIIVIEPDELYLKGLNFNPRKIRRAMNAGRKKVGEIWSDIEKVIVA